MTKHKKLFETIPTFSEIYYQILQTVFTEIAPSSTAFSFISGRILSLYWKWLLHSVSFCQFFWTLFRSKKLKNVQRQGISFFCYNYKQAPISKSLSEIYYQTSLSFPKILNQKEPFFWNKFFKKIQSSNRCKLHSELHSWVRQLSDFLIIVFY